MNNTAVGQDALRENTTAGLNTAVGADALAANTTGLYKSAIGSGALASNTTGPANTALGENALLRNTTAVGEHSSWSMGNGKSYGFGDRNTALGAYALSDGETHRSNTAIGYRALQHAVGDNNIALGDLSGGAQLTTGNNNIDIGNEGVAGENGTIRIGRANQVRTFIAGISGSVVTGATV